MKTKSLEFLAKEQEKREENIFSLKVKENSCLTWGIIVFIVALFILIGASFAKSSTGYFIALGGATVVVGLFQTSDFFTKKRKKSEFSLRVFNEQFIDILQERMLWAANEELSPETLGDLLQKVSDHLTNEESEFYTFNLDGKNLFFKRVEFNQNQMNLVFNERVVTI